MWYQSLEALNSHVKQLPAWVDAEVQRYLKFAKCTFPLQGSSFRDIQTLMKRAGDFNWKQRTIDGTKLVAIYIMGKPLAYTMPEETFMNKEYYQVWDGTLHDGVWHKLRNENLACPEWKVVRFDDPLEPVHCIRAPKFVYHHRSE